MKVIVTITIVMLFLVLPFTVNAQNGSCNNAGSFVDWKKCLEGNPNPNPPAVAAKIVTPVFINTAYQRIYDTTFSYCQGNKYSWAPSTNCDEIASKILVNAFALDIFALVLAVMFIIFTFLIFISRIKYISSGDNEEEVKKAKKMATAAIAGFLFIFVGLIIGEILAVSIGSNIWEIKLFG